MSKRGRSISRGRRRGVSVIESEEQGIGRSKSCAANNAVSVSYSKRSRSSSSEESGLSARVQGIAIRRMSYNDYERSRASLLEDSAWYNVKALLQTLKNMRKINFSLVECRQQQMQALNTLNDECPYAVDKRFPATGRYICEGTGDWIRKFQQLRTSLSAKSLAKDPKASTSDKTNDENDSLLSFHNSITSIISQLTQGEYIYTQKVFEETFGLVWGA